MQFPLCPANYFGKGENYVLSDNPDEMHWFTEMWEKWEKENPDDPTGEKALIRYKELSGSIDAKLGKNPPELIERVVIIKEAGRSPEQVEKEYALVDLQMKIPRYIADEFKEFCRKAKRRPRDMFIFWVKLRTQIKI